MPKVIRDHPLLAVVGIGSLVAFGIYGMLRGRDETVVYLVAVGLAMAVVARLYVRIGLPAPLLWLLGAWGIAHLAGGLIPVGGEVLYNQPLGIDAIRYDRVVHAFGFGTATVVVWYALRPMLDPSSVTRTVVIVALAGMGVGALNEMIEFITTRLDAGANVGGFENTGWDLVANAIGAATAAWFVVRRDARG